MLEAIKYVKKVIIFEEDTPYELIKVVKPDVIIKGGDYLPSDVVGHDLCEVRIFDTLEGYSSTRLINSQIFNLHSEN
jgi:D-beta-D-heptose 7-phosphate kinase/D-beta-D-heptose 1-phosphate adenosyltransferase